MNDDEFEKLLWLATYVVAVATNSAMAKEKADTAIMHFRHSDAFFPYQPPAEWVDEDVPF